MKIELYENKNDSPELINVGLLFFLYEQVQFDSLVLQANDLAQHSQFGFLIKRDL